MNEPNEQQTIAIALSIERGAVRDILLTACEQGSGYWARVEHGAEYIAAMLVPDAPQLGEPIAVHEWADDEPGDEPTIHTVWPADVAAAWALVPPRVLGRLLSEDYDALDADIFFQCVVLKEVRYG